MTTEHDPFDRLHDSARRGSRVRIGVGAAIVLLLVALVVSVVISMAGLNNAVETFGGASDSGPVLESAEPDVLLVHVLGAVVRPGLVELAPEARVIDAVAAAGGLAADADPAGVNLARAVTDGEQLVVPRVGEVQGTDVAGETNGLVNLNTADAAALEELPRIGPSLAERIVAWRETYGAFSSVDDLRNVSGIGEKVFAGLRDLVTV
ncbi:ComEA family DNA-binding protein [Agromyces atrinae]|uniref:ComEA family DNA-binding protein n=1 Tax=Agromyces atrinae TaxID=592376 RepID=UPI001F571BE1|nr:ComEA family DNA-binding protein [Agromyces atrinae]MCI2958797.1 ComEA family DNA-binding protein [Agromyces atrinae]